VVSDMAPRPGHLAEVSHAAALTAVEALDTRLRAPAVRAR
jgi:hypothetical protein